MEIFVLFFGLYGYFLLPIFGVTLCLNLIKIVWDLVNKSYPETKNIFWLTISFAMILVIFASLIIISFIDRI
ncbi:hypothetical protein SAMN05216389_12155 [Oceanobacillus limi]|uniref:Uncharacterized protein n=1 Tax=Oceanobacillus limi TaxID=930131 RepID=A0A1I0GFY9_9BACI|nr:hypothetical protein SAMN05216389_12155 [Oceanobacillus limi]